MTSYDTILFDFDGTLIDSREGVERCLRHAFEQLGFDSAMADPTERFIGPSLMESFTTFCGFDHETAVRAVRLYRERYSDVGLYEMVVFPGVREMLERLYAQGRRLMLATLKPEPYVQRILDHYSLAPLFAGYVGSNLDGSRNTKDEVVADAIAALGRVALDRIVMVGDHTGDVLAARNHGIDAIAVSYGSGSTADLELAGPVAIAHSVEELGSLLGTNDSQPCVGRQGRLHC